MVEEGALSSQKSFFLFYENIHKPKGGRFVLFKNLLVAEITTLYYTAL